MQRPERDAADLKRFAFFNANIGAGKTVIGRGCNLATHCLPHIEGRRDVVGVCMCVEDVGQRQSKRLTSARSQSIVAITGSTTIA
jgi:hypothetical protein